MCVSVHACVCAHTCGPCVCPLTSGPEEDLASPGTDGIDDYVSTGNGTQVLCKSHNRSQLLRHLSSPHGTNLDVFSVLRVAYFEAVIN